MKRKEGSSSLREMTIIPAWRSLRSSIGAEDVYRCFRSVGERETMKRKGKYVKCTSPGRAAGRCRSMGAPAPHTSV